ncbi:MAG: SDR family NAD(P)-dependent oxidoreductase [Neomegalonema sp.]|nr:SDR family NAD(P)-dependent oxidoreductase [Neomegalonema sp.]
MVDRQTLSMASLPHGYRAAIIGGAGAIGGAIVDTLRADPRCGAVLSFARRPQNGESRLDLADEASITSAAARAGEIQLLFIATGGLIIDGNRPEKALSQLQPEMLQQQFALNAIGPALILKHFERNLARRERALVGVLSARVGSIGDNRLGGWYGYRAAKAALNQYLRCASIEMARARPNLVLAALHPGTVESPLSRPFRPEGARNPGILTPRTSAHRLLTILDQLAARQSGTFWDHAGAAVPW